MLTSPPAAEIAVQTEINHVLHADAHAQMTSEKGNSTMTAHSCSGTDTFPFATASNRVLVAISLWRGILHNNDFCGVIVQKEQDSTGGGYAT
jgi:hypothetical protein